MPRMQGYQASQKQNNGERKTRKRNVKQALKTIIYFILMLDLRTYITELPKLEIVGNYFI